MPPVFGHGRLRLYLLKLLDESPRHGYEVIRLLEERFHGLYAPSAGTVYPRLAKLEAEGLVTHTTEGGRKVYSLTPAGRAELADRGGELADLEMAIRESVAELAAEIRDDVRGSAGTLRREVREAARRARAGGADGGGRDRDADRDAGGHPGGAQRPGPGSAGPGRQNGGARDGAWSDKESWRQAKEDMRRALDEWREQARRAKEESRRARQDAQRAREQAQEAQDFAREEIQRIAQRIQERTQGHLITGDWQQAVREGLAEVSRGVSRLSRPGPARPAQEERPAGGPGTGDAGSGRAPDEEPERSGTARPPRAAEDAGRPRGQEPPHGEERPDGKESSRGQESPRAEEPPHVEEPPRGERPPSGGDAADSDPQEPAWSREFRPSGDPARDLDRLLDRFRDGIRDTARDLGVTEEALAEARRSLAATAVRVDRLLRDSGSGPGG
ncbi:helix-turn-helix transcriptional regulator [Streptomyces sp. NPDC018031]|uniref:PadR family transcriptional regulator n=1 Tax=Streptomyces sp. NPDC018031 TaxID=3365033 RepID=UPI0037B25212